MSGISELKVSCGTEPAAMEEEVELCVLFSLSLSLSVSLVSCRRWDTVRRWRV